MQEPLLEEYSVAAHVSPCLHLQYIAINVLLRRYTNYPRAHLPS